MLSESSIAKLRDAKTAIEEYEARRVEEINAQVSALKRFSLSFNSLAQTPVDKASELALSLAQDILGG